MKGVTDTRKETKNFFLIIERIKHLKKSSGEISKRLGYAAHWIDWH